MGTEFQFYKIASLPEAEDRDGSIEPCLIVLVVFNTIDRISHHHQHLSPLTVLIALNESQHWLFPKLQQ